MSAPRRHIWGRRRRGVHFRTCQTEAPGGRSESWSRRGSGGRKTEQHTGPGARAGPRTCPSGAQRAGTAVWGPSSQPTVSTRWEKILGGAQVAGGDGRIPNLGAPADSGEDGWLPSVNWPSLLTSRFSCSPCPPLTVPLPNATLQQHRAWALSTRNSHTGFCRLSRQESMTIFILIRTNSEVWKACWNLNLGFDTASALGHSASKTCFSRRSWVD